MRLNIAIIRDDNLVFHFQKGRGLDYQPTTFSIFLHNSCPATVSADLRGVAPAKT
jgi:hypothetical protein